MDAQACRARFPEALFRPSIGGDHILNSLLYSALDAGAEVMAVHRAGHLVKSGGRWKIEKGNAKNEGAERDREK
jgi:hypothetical protein